MLSDNSFSIISNSISAKGLAGNSSVLNGHTTLEKTPLTLSYPSFAVILPMFNEQACAASCIESIYAALKNIPAVTGIIAVNDGSTDSTLLVLESLQERIPGLIVVNREQNGGYGGANRSGFKAAEIEGFEYVLVMDADGTQDPKFISDFLPPMSKSVDFIKATRYSKYSAVIGVSFQRKFVSWVGNLLARLMLRLPITDYTNGFRAIRTDLANQLDTHERGFAVLVEEVSKAKKLNATFAEVPYTLTARIDPGSQSKFVYSTQVYKNYLRHLFHR
ncbi:MAG: glycosyltransferase [Candidatus Obscuribacter sp.]|nr:glycosyltransferase [Candidatus Obscuribacter sp.]